MNVLAKHPTSTHRFGRDVLFLVLALLAPIGYEIECCASIHDDCARADFQTGCDACPSESGTAALTFREFTPPTSRPPIPPLQLSAHDCGALQSSICAAFGSCPLPASLVQGRAEGMTALPLFILHSILLV